MALLTWYGEGGLCYIGGHHNETAACRGGLENPGLGRPGQVGVQGQHMHQPCALSSTGVPLVLSAWLSLSDSQHALLLMTYYAWAQTTREATMTQLSHWWPYILQAWRLWMDGQS